MDVTSYLLGKKASGGGSGLNVYSSTETKIGTWLGEDLYRSVIQLTQQEYGELTASGSKKLLPVSTYNINELIRADVVVKADIDNKISLKCQPMHNIGSTVGEYEAGVHTFENDNLQIVVGNTVLANLVGKIKVVLEYTKNTN